MLSGWKMTIQRMVKNLKKIFAYLLGFMGLLLLSNFTPIGNTAKQTIVANKIDSVGVLAPPPLFPTNATFETKAEVIGNATFWPIGGADGSDYYAQSFKALSDYIVNGGIWLQPSSGTTPNLRLMLCNNNVSGYPDIKNPIAYSSQNITGSMIDAKSGRFYLNLTKPIRVQQNETYWLVIDGYMDHVTAGEAASRRLDGNPYEDGRLTFSNNAGSTWEDWYPDFDLDFIVNFSNRQTKAEVLGTEIILPVGGFDGSDYYAQSFKALESYIVDAGVWIEANGGVTPNMRVQIWGNNATVGNHPNKNNVIASSRVIAGNEINSTAGRYFVHPNVSIPVIVGETYWLIIDGYYDHTTNGTARSRYVYGKNPYPDGNFVYSNDVGGSWSNWATSDLNFIVSFSARRSAIKMMKGNSLWTGIGGTGTWDYAGQSFKALDKYILNAGVWLQNNTNLSPAIRLLICPSTLANASQPDVNNPIAISIPITGQQIIDKQGMQYLNLTKPVEVVPGQTYFFIIDGYYDHTTAGNLKTYDRSDNPYKDGYELASSNVGATWTAWGFQYDLGVDITFSDVPYEAQCGSTDPAFEVGWQAATPYYGQSFIALNDYIADAGIWLAPWSGTTPDFRLLLVGNNATGYNHPDLTQILATSMKIEGNDIDSDTGLFFIKPSTPIPVERFQRYWIVIDGSYDKTTIGRASSRSVDYDAYPDGEFLWAYSDLGLGWHDDLVNDRYDLHFDVIFTHVNQPPTQPDVTISPLKPFDSDDLTVQFPIPSADFEEEPVLYYVEWYKNGVPQPAWANNFVVLESATLPTEDWRAKVTPYDGHINGTSASYTVHVQADIQTINHTVIADSQTFHVFTKSNTTITGFNFTHIGNTAKINFTSTGLTSTVGFCNITIPRTLMIEPWAITVNGILIDPPKTINATHTTIHLSYLTSAVPIQIQGVYVVPEFTLTMLILTVAFITLAVAIVKKKTTPKKP